jgi:hypothetical protein
MASRTEVTVRRIVESAFEEEPLQDPALSVVEDILGRLVPDAEESITLVRDGFNELALQATTSGRVIVTANRYGRPSVHAHTAAQQGITQASTGYEMFDVPLAWTVEREVAARVLRTFWETGRLDDVVHWSSIRLKYRSAADFDEVE